MYCMVSALHICSRHSSEAVAGGYSPLWKMLHWSILLSPDSSCSILPCTPILPDEPPRGELGSGHLLAQKPSMSSHFLGMSSKSSKPSGSHLLLPDLSPRTPHMSLLCQSFSEPTLWVLTCVPLPRLSYNPGKHFIYSKVICCSKNVITIISFQPHLSFKLDGHLEFTTQPFINF